MPRITCRYRRSVSGHDQHAGRPRPVDELAAGRQEWAADGRGSRGGLALGVVLGAAAAWNLAANLWLPWALYVPGALLVAATLVGVAVKIGGCRWSDLGLDRHDLRRGLAYGAVVALPVTLVLALGAALPATRGLFLDRRAAGISTAVLLYVALVRVPFGTVVLEETLFRGVLLGLGLRRWSQTTAVAVSCLAFGLWHVLPARHVTSFNPVFAGLAGSRLGWVYGVLAAVVATAVAGLVLCWLRLRSRSLLAPALVHATVNGLGYVLAFLAGRPP
jgi:membrane protease YdiL (CAAX protease family)